MLPLWQARKYEKKECRKWKREQGKGKGKGQNEEKDTGAVAFKGEVIVVCDEGCVNLTCEDSS